MMHLSYSVNLYVMELALGNRESDKAWPDFLLCWKTKQNIKVILLRSLF